MTEATILLASTSPFRKMLLANAGLTFATDAATIDERALEAALGDTADPSDVAAHLARAKAGDVAARHPRSVVIGCDQTMSLGLHRFHKPSSADEVRDTLRLLSGQTHQLNSAYALVRDGEILSEKVVSARLTVRPLSESFIEAYIARNGTALFQSVGAYQLEGEGVQLFSAIEGDYFTILGLPLLPLLEDLRGLGLIDG